MEFVGKKNASLCRDCHSLLEQIDAFEQVSVLVFLFSSSMTARV
jgi:hypothetical protein